VRRTGILCYTQKEVASAKKKGESKAEFMTELTETKTNNVPFSTESKVKEADNE
jgi:hypothetical protein